MNHFCRLITSQLIQFEAQVRVVEIFLKRQLNSLLTFRDRSIETCQKVPQLNRTSRCEGMLRKKFIARPKMQASCSLRRSSAKIVIFSLPCVKLLIIAENRENIYKLRSVIECNLLSSDTIAITACAWDLINYSKLIADQHWNVNASKQIFIGDWNIFDLHTNRLWLVNSQCSLSEFK